MLVQKEPYLLMKEPNNLGLGFCVATKARLTEEVLQELFHTAQRMIAKQERYCEIKFEASGIRVCIETDFKPQTLNGATGPMFEGTFEDGRSPTIGLKMVVMPVKSPQRLILVPVLDEEGVMRQIALN